MIIPVDLHSFAFRPESDPTVDALVLNRLLETMVQLNRIFLDANPKTPSLYAAGVKYGKTTEWLTIPALYSAGRGDCKSLATARIAELRNAGRTASAVFRFVRRPDGGKDFHILVAIGSGGSVTWEDPSRKLGMGQE